MEKKVLPKTYQKYGYMMFNCSVEEYDLYVHNCYMVKKSINLEEEFTYIIFNNVEEAIKKINSVFIPIHHGILPKTVYSLQDSNRVLVKELWFYNYHDRYLYQCAVERAWALGSHLDKRVKQVFYE